MSDFIPRPEEHGKRYHGAHDLGRDDPLWPRYVQDAEKWDDGAMHNWNGRMDVLLLFATLFSAIITAFLIEASKSLRPDPSEINTIMLIDIAITLRALKNESGSITQGPLPTLANYKPSPTNVVVNMLWFLSLCLSIIVALITSLVKQWCNSYMSDRIAPPCNQARIRQARFNKLNNWKAVWIVSMLPVLMHVALALFLIGLIFFLEELNAHIWKAALSVTLVAATAYLLMTLAPCYVPFCPYSTPLSSPKLWGYFSQWLPAVAIYIYRFFFETKLQPDFTIHSSWCQRQQHEISNNTAPDEITGDALNWIILHTPDSETRDMAIRSISSLKSEKTLKQLVVDPPGILPQVIQSFTSCFLMRTSPGEENEAMVEMDIDTVALHARALLVLVNRIMRTPNSSESTFVTISTWGIDNETVVAVEERFQWLARNCPSAGTKIVGLTGLSAWRRFVGHTHNSLDDQSELLVGLTQSLCWELSPDLRSEILHAMLVESAHWSPQLQGNQRAQLLSSLVDLICEPNRNIPEKSRAKLICSFAMLMIGLNQGQTRLRLPLGSDQPDMEAYLTHNFVQSIVNYYLQNPSRILGDEPSLLLLALAGLMEYYEHRIFDESSSENIGKIAPLLFTLDIFSRFQYAALPAAIWLNVDLREYFVEVLADYFQHAPNNIRPLTNTASVTTLTEGSEKLGEEDTETLTSFHPIIPLLQALVNNTAFWKDPACVQMLRVPILHVWSRSDDPDIRTICLRAIASNLKQTHLASYANMLFAFDIPYKLVELMRTQEITKLRTPSARIFGLLSEDARGVEHKSLGFITRILSDGLLETFVRYILSSYPHEYNAYGKYWGEVILEAVRTRLINHHTRDEKLQGTYNYLKKRIFLAKEASEQPTLRRRSSLSLSDLIDRLLRLMDSENEELEKDYIRSKIPKIWLDKLEEFKNARTGPTSSPDAGPSSAPGAARGTL